MGPTASFSTNTTWRFIPSTRKKRRWSSSTTWQVQLTTSWLISTGVGTWCSGGRKSKENKLSSGSRLTKRPSSRCYLWIWANAWKLKTFRSTNWMLRSDSSQLPSIHLQLSLIFIYTDHIVAYPYNDRLYSGPPTNPKKGIAWSLLKRKLEPTVGTLSVILKPRSDALLVKAMLAGEQFDLFSFFKFLQTDRTVIHIMFFFDLLSVQFAFSWIGRLLNVVGHCLEVLFLSVDRNIPLVLRAMSCRCSKRRCRLLGRWNLGCICRLSSLLWVFRS